MEAADEAADFFLGRSGRAPFLRTIGLRFQIAAGAKGVEQERGQAFQIGSGCGDLFFRFRVDLGIAREFVEADGYSLAEIHRAMFLARGDAQQPMAVAEVFIREAALLRTEKQGGAAAGKMLAEDTGGLLGAADRMLQLTLADGGGSNHQRAIRDGFGDGLELFGTGEQRLGANRRARLAKSQLVRVHHAKMEKAEVAHGAGGGANVKRIARLDKDDAQVVELGKGRQGSEFTAEEKR